MRFLVSIDTEGDNLWARPRSITTRNAAYLPRFQALCEAHGLRPSYLTNHEMATCDVFKEFGRDLLARDAGEIGMHLHAWNTPPLFELTGDDMQHHPYLAQYPEWVIRAKVRAMTHSLEDTFGRPMTTHRAGRWSLNAAYVRALVACGYLVDSSVTPGVSWASSTGDPRQGGGTDYRRFPEDPYWMGPGDLAMQSAPGPNHLLEIPMTTAPRWMRVEPSMPRFLRRSPSLRSVSERVTPPCWMRPRGDNLDDMVFLADRAIAMGKGHIQIMIHSSELMPGGSPTFPTARAVDGLYEQIERFFDRYKGQFTGATLGEYGAACRGAVGHVRSSA